MSGEGKISRRNFLASSTLLATTVGALSGVGDGQQEAESARKVSDRSKSDPGPTNPALDAQNPNSIVPPATDAGSVSAFKYPFSLAHKRLYEGGWSREVTVRELPVAKTIAGVDMRITAGGIRELHWHAAAEWAFMLYGGARITAIDANGLGDHCKSGQRLSLQNRPTEVAGSGPVCSTLPPPVVASQFWFSSYAGRT
jgi:oxalate decarboxylase